MALPVINSGGISAYCSGLIVNQESETYFMSVAGYQTAVKGIMANFLEYRSITVPVDKEYIYLFSLNAHFLDIVRQIIRFNFNRL